MICEVKPAMTIPANPNGRMDVQNIAQAIEALGLSGADVCVHSSMRSFGAPLENGADTVIDAFLAQDCTVMVPTFTYDYEAVAPETPVIERNGITPAWLPDPTAPHKVFHVDSTDLSVEDMGAFPKAILHRPGRLRGNHALNSFAAIGKNANALIQGQTSRDVYAPFRVLCDHDGYVLMLGVGLHCCTLIHQAELLSGRNPFIRWAYDENDNVFPVAEGSCSEAFEVFADALRPYSKEIVVGSSRWVLYKARDILRICTEMIRENQNITHCGDPECCRCPDAVRGGPITPEGFWEKYNL